MWANKCGYRANKTRLYTVFGLRFKRSSCVTYGRVCIKNAAIGDASVVLKKRGSRLSETQLQTTVWAAFLKTQL